MAKTNTSGKKKKNGGLIAACIILALFVIVLIGGFLVFRSYYSLANYVSDDKAGAEANISSDAIESTKLSDEDAAAVADVKGSTDGVEVDNNKNLYNLLLIGVDRRDDSWNGNSDSMILLSLNKSTHKIHMISFMRDLYAEIGSYGVRKLNAACAIGGPTLLAATIQENYKVRIDNYACVDFVSMANIIDLLGGVTIDVSAEEAETANGLILDMCNLRGMDPAGHQFDYGAGTYEADGLMAVGYSRIRFVGNADYERTERQRVVMQQIMGKIRAMNSSEMNSFIKQALPYVTHNIDTISMLSLIAQMPSYLDYDLEQSRVPYDGLYSSQGEILVPTEPDTILRLQEELNS